MSDNISEAFQEQRPKRVLFVSYLFPPVGGVGVQRVLKWVKYLPEHGWNASVLTVANPSVPLFDESLLKQVPASTVVRAAKTYEPSYAAKTAAASSEAPAGFVSRIKSAIKAPLVRTAKSLLQPDPQILWRHHALREGTKLLREIPHDVIVATGPPFSSFLVGATLSKRSGVPLVLDYRDEWGISSKNWEQRRPGRMASAVQNKMETHALRAASLVLGTTPRGADEFREQARAAGSKADVAYVWNGFDADDFPNVGAVSKPDLGHGTSRFRLAFTGTLWTLNSAAGFVDGVLELARTNPSLLNELELVFAGRRMPDQEACLDRLSALPLKMTRLGFVPHGEAAQLMQSSDALLLPTSMADGLERVVCAKTFEYLATGKPIFCVSKPGDQMDAVRVSPASICASADDPSAVAKGLAELIERHCLGVEFPEPNLDQFDRKKLAGDLAGHLNSLVDGSAIVRPSRESVPQ